MRNLMAIVVLVGLPATGTAQKLVTFTTGYRAAAGDSWEKVQGGPLVGIDFRPIRWGWGALGLEASWAPAVNHRDSASHPPEYCESRGGDPVNCGSFRHLRGESTTQVGITARVGPARSRTAPFGEVGLGYYGARLKSRQDLWDSAGRGVPEYSSSSSYDESGFYARVGGGIQVKPWNRGPELAIGARYRWAIVGMNDAVDRSGVELVLGVRIW
jgi:hypothetical protein